MTSAVGNLIGPFRLTVPLATGALGQTLRAENVGSGESVAVKLFHQRLSADGTFAARFRPILQAADIKHPNILPIREFGEQAGQYFVIMDFISTGSLRTLLSQREIRLPLRRALEAVRQAAGGIAAAHARGVLHRDLKPENVLVEERGAEDTIRVADFGLTRLAETGLTIDGSMAFGSLPYMAPEQLRGLPIDVRSDMYSLGVVLYEAATGFPPFQVKNLGEALSKHLTAKPPAPRALQPNIPASLEQLILRSLEKDPGNRIQSAIEFAALLQEEINRLPGKPLVAWYGPVAASPNEPIVARRDNGSGAAGKRFALPARDAGTQDRTFPPPVEPSSDARKRVQKPTTDSRRIGVVPERETLTLVPGQLSIFTVTLTNNGRTVDAFSLMVRGVDEGWAQTPSQPQHLNPGQRAVVPLSIMVPRAPTSRAGTYPVTIVARSRDNPEEEGSAPSTWTVQPFADTLLSLDPPKARGWRSGDFAVAITNNGGTSAKYTVTAQDDERILSYRMSSTEVTLEPGASLRIPLVTSARLRPIGGVDTRMFTVTAKSEMGRGVAEPPKSVVGQFVHRALIPIWLPPLALAVGIAAFLFANQRSKRTLTVVPQALQVARGFSSPLEATVTNAKSETVTGGPPVSWVSRDTAIATVARTGVVTGVREGSTMVTARVGKNNQSVQIVVTAAPPDVVELSPRRLSMLVGATAVLRATVRDAHGRALPVNPTWVSSDVSVATVGGGRVTARAPGTATVTAQIDSKSATADVLILPRGPQDPIIGVEDCIVYEPSSSALSKPSKDRAGTGWRVTDGTTVIATLDRESEAYQVIAHARRFKAHCFIGRGNTRTNHSDYIIEYWTAPTNVPSSVPNEDCREYDRASLVIKEVGATGFSLEDRNGRLSLADTRADAQKAWNIAKDHLAFCVIARNNTRPNHRDYMVQYWK